MMFEGKYRSTKKMVAVFYEVDERTIGRCVEQNLEGLKHNGYVLCKGKQRKELNAINVGSKTIRLALFNFRLSLNVGLSLAESEKAKQARSIILVIGCMNEKAGSGTKYNNRCDIQYLPAAAAEKNSKMY